MWPASAGPGPHLDVARQHPILASAEDANTKSPRQHVHRALSVSRPRAVQMCAVPVDFEPLLMATSPRPSDRQYTSGFAALAIVVWSQFRWPRSSATTTRRWPHYRVAPTGIAVATSATRAGRGHIAVWPVPVDALGRCGRYGQMSALPHRNVARHIGVERADASLSAVQASDARTDIAAPYASCRSNMTPPFVHRRAARRRGLAPRMAAWECGPTCTRRSASTTTRVGSVRR